MLNSVIKNTSKPINEKTKHVNIKFEVHPPVFQVELPLESANNKAVRKVAREMNPNKSNLRTSFDLNSLRTMNEIIIPNTPIGTFTSKIVCQENLSIR